MAVIDDIFNTGGDILDTVQKAAETGDYSHLSSDIRSKVNTAANRYRASMDSYRTGTAGSRENYTDPGAQQSAGRTAAGTAGANIRESYFLQTRPDKHGNILKQIGGGIGAVISGGLAILFLLTSLLLIGESVPAMIVALVLTALFAGLTWFFIRMIRHGSSVQKLIERYYAYGKALGSAEYFSIRDLASATGQTEEKVRRDIEEMRRESILPYAAMDRNKTTVMLTDRVYKQYQAAELSRTQREEAARKKAMQEAAAKGGSWGRTGKAADTSAAAVPFGNQAGRKDTTTGKTGTSELEKEWKPTGNAEVDSILEDGHAYIRRIRQVNDEIPDTEIMSDKLYRLENIMRRIFEQVQNKPESARDCRKLMNYYLPTTIKLLEAYVELYRQPEAGENIRSSKQNIEETMDIINDAFEKLFDNMFENQAWDISSDINVMKTMMKQDGLAESEMMPGDLTNDNPFAQQVTEGYTDGYTDDLTAGPAAVEKK